MDALNPVQNILLAAALPLPSLPLFAQQQATAPRSREAREMVWEGNRLYDEGHYAEAEIFYRKSQETEEAPEVGRFNLGAATYQQERYEEAAKTWASVAERADLSAEDRADAWYNSGNALFEEEQFDKALEAYKQALRQNSSHDDARHNLAMSRRALQEQQEQEKQDQEQDQNEDQEKNDDQQDQQGDQEKEQQDQDGEKQNEKEQGEQEQDQQQGDGEPSQEQPDNQPQPNGEPEERSLSPEELERILDALEQDERAVQQKINAQKKPVPSGKADKDW